MNMIPRNEYPRPDFVRDEWLCLNGPWQFAEDFGRSGRERGLWKNDAANKYDLTITVPFCRESVLSGLGHTDFCESVWYRRAVTLPAGWQAPGKRVLLHVGACDWRTEVWVNGQSVGLHTGGYVSFSFDITTALTEGENVLTVCADDTLRTGDQASGKQSHAYGSHGCHYTRTTGIWQTVWLESVPENYVKTAKIFTDIVTGTVTAELAVCGRNGLSVTAEASFGGKPEGSASAVVSGGVAVLQIPLTDKYLWDIGQGNLYDLDLTLEGGDKARLCFGLRSVEVRDGAIVLNGRRIFQRLVLDQGFYPDGIYTAPTDGELRADIERSIACGFNGARLHQKIFEPRFLHWCDVMGYIVWGEHGNWGLDIARPGAWANFIPEWVETVTRDFNHPAIIGWCPLNETQRNEDVHFLHALAAVTRTLDPTRAYIDTSGWTHIPGVTDILDNHDYDQDPVTFRQRYMEQYEKGTPVDVKHSLFPIVSTFVSEYGGIRWAEEGAGWGYGNAPKTGEEFIERFRGLTDALLDNPMMGGLCYTQLTDVEQEVNGLYTYDRRAKFPPAVFKAILSRRAVSEE